MMPPLTKFIVIIPLVLAFVSFILTTLALFAGHQKGFMEDYAVVRLNTSMIGQNILKNDKPKDTGKSDNNKSFLDDVRDKWHDVKDDAKGKIGDIAGDVIGDVADKLGVSEWYSVHIMNSCEGNYGRDATADNFKLNVTNCTTSTPAYRFNLTEILDHEMSVGPFHINLAKIDWPDSIQDKLDNLNDSLLALFVFYVLGVGFSGLTMLACIPTIILPEKKYLILLNLSFSSLGAFFIALGSIVVTAAGSIGTNALNKAGEKVSVVAEQGTKFYIISWIAAGFMTMVTLFWAAQFFLLNRKIKKQMAEESKEAY
ncbi:hypothetical protein PT974_00771 [Cladobotryum mycophilum]|uniref:SUR7 protein n=1 Tax=Cladobotryum mycophilum TaxID=491253 RepID=A0ABR0T203_9HYPO